MALITQEGITFKLNKKGVHTAGALALLAGALWASTCALKSGAVEKAHSAQHTTPAIVKQQPTYRVRIPPMNSIENRLDLQTYLAGHNIPRTFELAEDQSLLPENPTHAVNVGPYANLDDALRTAQSIVDSGFSAHVDLTEDGNPIQTLHRPYPEKGSFDVYAFEIREAATLVDRYLAKNNVQLPPDLETERLLDNLIQRESSYRKDARSSAGARGLTQLLHWPYEELKTEFDLPWAQEEVYADPIANLTVGGLYLGKLVTRFNGNLKKALEAYNQGPTSVAKNGAFPGPSRYAASILDGAMAGR